MKVIVMGVSGCGKSTVGKLLAKKLNCTFIDGDDLHPESNKIKMASGIPLNDEDRWPWLEKVGSELQGNQDIVIACSALKKIYRETITKHARSVNFVHLVGSKELLLSRLGNRTSHFMPATLLDSQLDSLEELAPEEHGKTFEISLPLEVLVNQASKWITLQT